MDYREAELFLLQREMFGWKLGLERMVRFLAELEQPQHQYDSIHIAGTNGKGSVTAMLSSILHKSGLSTGMYTSPHLQSLRERIRINGKSISEKAVTNLVERWRPLIEELGCTFFETMTGLALRHFADVGVQAAVIETGLGGRLDATNVILPRIAIITNISFDHMDHLGESLSEIAAEKAGIMKQDIPCVIGSLPEEAERVIRERAVSTGTPLLEAAERVAIHHLQLTDRGSRFTAVTSASVYSDLSLRLPGPHQVGNSRIVICAAEVLAEQGLISLPLALRQGLAETEWSGRFEIIQDAPQILIDVAHNPGGFQRQKWMWRHFYPHWQKALVLGLVKEKDLQGVLSAFPKDILRIFVVPAPTPRRIPVEELVGALQTHNLPATACSSVMEGVRQAEAWAIEDDNRVICITGSHYVVGEALSGIKGLTI